MRAWSFDTVCRQVELEHPEWTREDVKRRVDEQNATRLMQGGPSMARYVVVDDRPEVVLKPILDAPGLSKDLSECTELLLVLPFCPREEG